MTDYERGRMFGLTWALKYAEEQAAHMWHRDAGKELAAGIRREINRLNAEEEKQIVADYEEAMLQAERSAAVPETTAVTAAEHTKVVMMLPVITARLAELESRMDAVELRGRPAEWGTEK